MEDTAENPLSYPDVLAHWDRSRAFGDTRDFRSFANDMEELHPGAGFGEAAARDGWWTRFSTRLDQNVFDPVAKATTAPLGEAVGGLFGAPEAGRRVGMELPRGLAETVPLLAAEALSGGAATPIVAGALATGGLMGAHTYAETGSPQDAAISGATGALLPAAGRFGGGLLPRALGLAERVPAATLETGEEFAGGVLPKAGVSPFAFKTAQLAGSQAGMVATNEASMYAEDRTLGRPYDPLSAEFLLQQIPFTVYDAVRGVTTGIPPTAEDIRGQIRVPMARTTTKYTPPEVSQPEADATIDATLQNLQSAYSDPAATPEQKAASLAAANALIQNPIGTTAAASVVKAPETTSEITGRGRELYNGNWKVLVPNEQGNDRTVFVNGVKPTQNADGSLTFQAKASQVRDAFTPFKRSDVGLPEAGQTELPAQENPWQGFAPDQQRTLEEYGITVPPEMPEDVKQTLRQHADQIEAATQELASAKVKVMVVPKSAEEIPSVVGDVETAKPKINAAIEAGATPTQAVEKARLSTQTSAADAVMQQLNALREQAHVISLTAEGKPQAIYSDYIRDETGENFQSRGLAEAFRDAHPEYENYTVRAAGKGGSGFYLARAINREVSFEGAKLEKVLVDPSGSTALESRPDVSFEAALEQLDRASQSPRIFANEAGFDDVSDAILALRQARVVMPMLREGKTFEQIQSALAEAKVAGFTSPRNAVAVMQAVREGLAGFTGKYRNFSLDSFKPFDEEVVKQTGLFQPNGVENALKWFAGLDDQGTTNVRAFLQRVLELEGVKDLKFELDPQQPPGYVAVDRKMTMNWLPAKGEEVRWGLDMAHEYMHHVLRDMEARNDPAAVQLRAVLTQALDALRKSAEIPAKVRAALPQMRGWYEEYSRSNVPTAANEFYDKWTKAVGTEHDDWLHTAYGLTNEQELMAQLFGSPKLLDLVSRTKLVGPERSTILQKLSQVVNRIFGGKPEHDNALAQIMGAFDQYLSGTKVPPRTKTQITGRLYDISKVPDQQTLFENRTPSVTVRQSYNGRDLLRDSLIASGVRPEALASRIDTVENVFNTGSLQPSIDGFSREMSAGTLPATAQTGPLKPELTTALLSGTPKDVNTLGKGLLMNEVPVHQELYQRMLEDFNTAKDLYNNVRKGLVPGELPPQTRQNLQDAHVRLDALNRALNKQAIDISRFNDLDNFTSTGMTNTRISGLSSNRLPAPPDPTELQTEAHAALGLVDARTEKSREVLERGKLATGTNWLRRNFMFMQYLKELIPSARPAIDRLFQIQGSTNFWKNELDAVYQMDPATKEFDKGRRDANIRVATNETLMRAASDIKLWNQTEEAAGRVPSLDDAFVKQQLSRFNPKDRQAIITEANNAKAVHDHWTEVTTPRFLAQKNQATVAKVIALREQGMPPDQARELAGQFSAAIDQLKNPQTAPMGVEQLNALRPSVKPETFLAAFQLSKGLSDDSDAHIEFMRSRPNYVTEQRYDAHMIRMVKPDNSLFNNAYPTREAALTKVKELEAKGYKLLEYVPKSDANVPHGGIDAEFIGKLRELDLQAQNRVQQALTGVDPQILATVLPEMQRASDYEASLAAFSPVPGAGFPKRHFVAGREELNMVQQQNMFYGRATNWMRHQLTRGETELDLLHPDLLADREATKLVRDKVGEYLTPDSQLARKMAEFTYNWKLAGNFGVNALHLIQSLNTGMASLISETGGVGDALALTTKAQKAVIQRALTRRWDTADHDWLIRRAGAEGVLGNVTWEGDIGDSTRNALQYASSPMWQKPFEALKWAARSWNNTFFKFNDAIGLISAFDLGRSRGMDYEEAFNFARDVKNRGYFTGGKTQRPGFWSAFGPQAKAVPQLMSSLQTYVNGWFSLLSYNYVRGFGKAPEGMSAAQVLAAKKAFVYQLSAQAVLAGALGLPGVGQGMALFKQTTGVDIMSWLRQHLGDLFGEDQNGGGMMTTLALHGATAAFTPVDTSGRHMPSVPYIGVTPYKGFDLANLAGAPVSSAADLVKGLMAAAKGDTIGMANLLPEVLRGPLRLWQGEGDVRDPSGNLLTQLSPAEKFVTALGMNPSRVTAVKETAQAVKEASARARAEKTDVINNLATVYRKNGAEQGHVALLQYLQQHPDEDGKTLVRAVSQRVLGQSQVQDWSQKANVGADLTGLSGNTVSQSDRLSQLQGMQQSLGLYSRYNPREAMLTHEADLLRESDPTMGVAEAMDLVRSRRPRRQNTFSVLPESQ